MFSCIFFPAQTFSIHDLIFAANAHADAHSDSECVDTQRRADKQITQTVHTRTLLSTDGRTAQGLAAALSKLFSSRSMNLHRSCCQVPRHRTRCREKAAGGVRATVSYTSALHAHLTTPCWQHRTPVSSVGGLQMIHKRHRLHFGQLLARPAFWRTRLRGHHLAWSECQHPCATKRTDSSSEHVLSIGGRGDLFSSMST